MKKHYFLGLSFMYFLGLIFIAVGHTLYQEGATVLGVGLIVYAITIGFFQYVNEGMEK